MLARVDAGEMAEWQAEYRHNPWGESRADVLSAIVAWTVYTMGRGKGSPKLELDAFMPKYGEESEPEQKTPEQMKHMLALFTAMAGGDVKAG